MSSNTKSTKKRRAGEGNNGGASGFQVDSSEQDELKVLSSHLTSMMEHNRVQTENMTDMMDMMKSMQGEIASLRNKNDAMEKVMKKTLTKCDNLEKSLVARFDIVEDKQNTISEDMNSRFDDMDKKQKYHEVLLKNQQWKYSAPRPSLEYWDTVGVDDEAAESFLEQIKKYTEEMRYGTGDGNIDIDVDSLPYNEVFLPHWKEFANALEQYQHYLRCLPEGTNTKLRLCDLDLPDTVLDLLSKALESTYFPTFHLWRNGFGQHGIDFALKHLQSNRILKEFSLYNNTIDNMKDIKQLCLIVDEHPSIEDLDLESCCGRGIDGHEMLQLIMNAGKSKLDVINLSHNGICTMGGTFISEFLSSNYVLAQLNLCGNQLDDNDAMLIARALEHNTKLRVLDVMNNNLTRTGWAALRKAEFDDTSLNSAADSNHTCAIWYPSGNDAIQEVNTSEMNGQRYSEHNFDPVYVRQKKVYSIVSSRNRHCSNVGHFDDIPVEFLPDMLHTFQQYSEYHTEDGTGEYLTSPCSQDINDVNPLSLVYELCRYWDKSLAVYELLSL